MIYIRNLKDGAVVSSNTFKVDRSTPLGNPYPITKRKTRQDVIDEYRAYLFSIISGELNIYGVLEYYNEIKTKAKEGDVTLYCHCWPLPCHADVIKEFIENDI